MTDDSKMETYQRKTKFKTPEFIDESSGSDYEMSKGSSKGPVWNRSLGVKGRQLQSGSSDNMYYINKVYVIYVFMLIFISICSIKSYCFNMLSFNKSFEIISSSVSSVVGPSSLVFFLLVNRICFSIQKEEEVSTAGNCVGNLF